VNFEGSILAAGVWRERLETFLLLFGLGVELEHRGLGCGVGVC